VDEHYDSLKLQYTNMCSFLGGLRE
jgi:hypothetical protein